MEWGEGVVVREERRRICLTLSVDRLKSHPRWVEGRTRLPMATIVPLYPAQVVAAQRPYLDAMLRGCCPAGPSEGAGILPREIPGWTNSQARDKQTARLPRSDGIPGDLHGGFTLLV